MRKLLIFAVMAWPGMMGTACAQQSTPAQNQAISQPQATIMKKEKVAWPVLMQNFLTEPDAQGLVRFDYKRLTETPEALASLDAYITYHESLSPSTMDAASATAYWANLYNALTVRIVAENYPVKSIRKISKGPLPTGPWKRDISVVEGENISLDKIEHGILRVQYPSPLIHYMVNCASVGCPNLIAGEWSAANLDPRRDQAAREFINSPRGVRVTPKGLVVSSIYKWFDEDFGGNKSGVLNHIRQYADADLAAAIDKGAKITGYDYDWKLNGVGHE